MSSNPKTGKTIYFLLILIFIAAFAIGYFVSKNYG